MFCPAIGFVLSAYCFGVEKKCLFAIAIVMVLSWCFVEVAIPKNGIPLDSIFYKYPELAWICNDRYSLVSDCTSIISGEICLLFIRIGNNGESPTVTDSLPN